MARARLTHRLVERFAYACTVILLATAYFASESAERAPKTPTVMLVGDLGDETSFAYQVQRGARSAMSEMRTQDLAFRLVEFRSEEYLDRTGRIAEPAKLRHSLVQAIANYRPAAIVDASTSRVAPEVVAVARSLGIPVLITVATADGLLQGCRHALRLPATNTQQAIAIADAISGSKGVLIFYDDSAYGASLQSALVERLRGNGGETDRSSSSRVLPIAVAPTVSLLAVAQAWPGAPPDVVVYLGYTDRVDEAATAATSFADGAALAAGSAVGEGAMPRVMLSDGCYSERLPCCDSGPLMISIALPSSPGERRSPLTSGFQDYGHDVVVLLAHAFKSRRDGESLEVDVISAIAHQGCENTWLRGKYRFTPTGENALASFQVVPLAEFETETESGAEGRDE